MTDLVWRAGDVELRCGDRTLIMGVLNVTPDSFSDGGRFLGERAAVDRGLAMADEGADIVDVGGESTRPGSEAVQVSEEMERIVPVIERLAAHLPVPISVDTRRAEVARTALDAGAVIVNDVSAGRDPDMFDVVRDRGAGYVLMHMLGEPMTMQHEPRYDDVVAEVSEYLRERIEAAGLAGIDTERVAVDPGIGFGKTVEHNLSLLRHVEAFAALDRPVLYGPSRKRFIGSLLGGADENDRLEGTLGTVSWLAARGVHVVRVHDVLEVHRALTLVDAIARAT
ncbi:MAG TPA: dihydropteroate synthase [Actinomycetota bacterium]|nr:dihydropteroate synthase [Actinomycetota bacterium]